MASWAGEHEDRYAGVCWPPQNSLDQAAEHGRARADRRCHKLVTPETLAQRIIFYTALAIVLILFVLAGFKDLV